MLSLFIFRFIEMQLRYMRYATPPYAASARSSRAALWLLHAGMRYFAIFGASILLRHASCPGAFHAAPFGAQSRQSMPFFLPEGAMSVILAEPSFARKNVITGFCRRCPHFRFPRHRPPLPLGIAKYFEPVAEVEELHSFPSFSFSYCFSSSYPSDAAQYGTPDMFIISVAMFRTPSFMPKSCHFECSISLSPSCIWPV